MLDSCNIRATRTSWALPATAANFWVPFWVRRRGTSGPRPLVKEDPARVSPVQGPIGRLKTLRAWRDSDPQPSDPWQLDRPDTNRREPPVGSSASTFAQVTGLTSPHGGPDRIVAVPISDEFWITLLGHLLGGQASSDPRQKWRAAFEALREHLRDDTGVSTMDFLPAAPSAIPRRPRSPCRGCGSTATTSRSASSRLKMFRLVMMEPGANGTKECSPWTRATRIRTPRQGVGQRSVRVTLWRRT